MDLVFGFDGGGTSCRAAIADRDGRILGRGVSGSANTASDPEAALSHILESASQAAHAAGLDAQVLRAAPAYLGLAGWNVEAGGEAFAARLPFAACVIEDDAGIALQGALGDGDGVVAVLGTGSVYLGREGGEQRRLGGWGFLVGDRGSGAWLGQALLQETLLAHDGVIGHSALTRMMMAEFSGEPARIVRFAAQERAPGFARFAPLVFEHAGTDAVAARIVGEGVRHVNAALSAIVRPGCPRLCLVGGVSRFYGPLIEERFRAVLSPPAGNALDGAVQLALRRFPVFAEKTA